MNLRNFAIFAVIALSFSISITTADAKPAGPRVVISGPDAGIQLHDGRVIQFEYIPFVLTHRNDDRLVVFEDGSAMLVEDDGCSAINHRGERFALRDC